MRYPSCNYPLLTSKWPALERYTSPPYDLTLKSNGCIIFIAALDSSKLVVTSKHSLGTNINMPVSHAQMGQKWLQKHLAAKGKTEEELAARLLSENLTAVAEVRSHRIRILCQAWN